MYPWSFLHTLLFGLVVKKMKTSIVTIEAEKQLYFCIYVLNKVLTNSSPVLLLYRNQCVDLHSKSMDGFLYSSIGLLNVASLGLYMTHI